MLEITRQCVRELADKSKDPSSDTQCAWKMSSTAAGSPAQRSVAESD